MCRDERRPDLTAYIQILGTKDSAIKLFFFPKKDRQVGKKVKKFWPTFLEVKSHTNRNKEKPGGYLF